MNVNGQLRTNTEQQTQKKPYKRRTYRSFVDAYGTVTGGAEGNRTPDLLNAIQALSQLSYSPSKAKKLRLHQLIVNDLWPYLSLTYIDSQPQRLTLILVPLGV